MEQVYVKTRAAWRRWLARNHLRSAGIWLVFFRKHAGEPTLIYEDAVAEALCFGWIDSIIKKLDEDRYLRKFTPRRAESRWSATNRERVETLVRQGLMTESGMALVEAAKAAGLWDEPDRQGLSFDMPVELERALKKNRSARKFFEQLAPSYRKQFVGWIATAKRRDTRERRVREAVALLAQGRKLGMK
jgi:uncharacterized protein YdeI (YjbR/CyaY-like superfamily)